MSLFHLLILSLYYNTGYVMRVISFLHIICELLIMFVQTLFVPNWQNVAVKFVESKQNFM
jgi:hypothetical protein